MIDEKAYQEEMAIVERHWPTVVKRLREAEAEIRRLKERLEQCEAALRGLLDDCDTDPERLSMITARAALEE